MDIKPQDGFQTSFLTTEADIAIGGGCAGAGKSYALLMEPLRHSQIKGFSATIFRRTTPQIRNSGGLWDTSYNLYSLLPDTKPRDISLQWVFEHIKVNFNHLEYEKNILDYQGAQLPLIMFDELTHFTEKMFFYMLSRNRSMCGVKPYIRATCNPDPESWVAEFISWWIDQDTGFPIPKRDGVLRYFTRDGQSIVWGDTKQEVIDKCPHIFAGLKEKGINLDDMVKSATFIHGDIYHNQKLIDKDPSYLANLLSQEDSIKSQLLEGNWKIKQDGLALCNYENIQNIFTNFAKKSTDRYISCDVARFGSDLAVIKVWEGLKVVKTVIFTKCETTEIVEAIEKEREAYGIPKSKVIVDADGLGVGVVDFGKYKGFANGSPALSPKGSKKDPSKKANYANLKTQCYYKLCELVNLDQIAIDSDNVYVDGKKSQYVGKIKYVDLVKKDLYAVKRVKADSDGKKQMSSKEAMKNALNGRSPDNGDALMMRMIFEIIKAPILEPFFV